MAATDGRVPKALPHICPTCAQAPGVRSGMPAFSVVIASHNGAAWLPSALASVCAQSQRDCEVVVVDDGSTDDTQRVLAPYAARIRVVTQARGGVSAARNAGVVVQLQIEDGAFHVWHAASHLPESVDAVRRIGAFVQRQIPIR